MGDARLWLGQASTSNEDVACCYTKQWISSATVWPALHVRVCSRPRATIAVLKFVLRHSATRCRTLAVALEVHWDMAELLWTWVGLALAMKMLHLATPDSSFLWLQFGPPRMCVCVAAPAQQLPFEVCSAA